MTIVVKHSEEIGRCSNLLVRYETTGPRIVGLFNTAIEGSSEPGVKGEEAVRGHLKRRIGRIGDTYLRIRVLQWYFQRIEIDGDCSVLTIRLPKTVGD